MNLASHLSRVHCVSEYFVNRFSIQYFAPLQMRLKKSDLLMEKNPNPFGVISFRHAVN